MAVATYKEQTKDAQQRRRRFLRNILPWIVVAIIALSLLGVRAVSNQMREQGILSVRSSILNAAEQCYAIEGAYPSSLAHLKEQYGIHYDENSYVVNYNVFAANVPPTVTVTLR